MECFGTTDFDNNSRLITLSAIIISGHHCTYRYGAGVGWGFRCRIQQNQLRHICTCNTFFKSENNTHNNNTTCKPRNSRLASFHAVTAVLLPTSGMWWRVVGSTRSTDTASHATSSQISRTFLSLWILRNQEANKQNNTTAWRHTDKVTQLWGLPFLHHQNSLIWKSSASTEATPRFMSSNRHFTRRNPVTQHVAEGRSVYTINDSCFQQAALVQVLLTTSGRCRPVRQSDWWMKIM